jgi:hypothetical protein
MISVLDGGEGAASSPGHLTPGEITLDTHWIGGWVGPRAGLDAVGVQRNFCVAGNRTPVVQPVVRRYVLTELSRLLSTKNMYCKLTAMLTLQRH